MAPRWHAATDAAAQVQALATSIASTLAHVIEDQGTACLAVSGGRSPIALFAALRVLPLRWADVSITLVDERAVPPDHADSNARLVREHLLQDAAAAARFFPLVLPLQVHGGSVDVDACVATANAPFQQPDVVILGMGDDGHTASLFPDAPELPDGVDRTKPPGYLPVRPGTAPHRRISLNLSALCAARRLFLSIAGPIKRAVFDTAAQDVAQPALPVSYVIHQREVPLDVYWTA
ncbi:6-phosphogluconolactonase [Ralstonia mannitolilytica]|uniref:6-phosphogluconolactonase n=1 Tax=Ralstonia mannitolilytica TaxID=105219 RepID=A0AAJ5D712_9RALS|nr:6-phosphogluconolactonase [Ralstonia mannitolilytica]CAG2131432.1 6-phosphogluconolactonase [Ralstonia mannitolilytica]CAJ0730664.1 6-phosphogluconolactonase [Ralstonia mannitolilytica]SUE24947.1 6-phosphogluconolactonase [Ralstonia mannitolilytica]SUE26359.1 6-phosphogluconolactonase [Ralstonia mannitolilytica]SUE36169.1 6-phosphogluconolactonase [Ralstonia mannitolilytica]